jgi:hypothetical protein
MKTVREKADANMKYMQEEIRTNQEKVDANLKELKEDIKTNQAKTDVNLEGLRKEIPSGQVEMRSTVNAIEEKLDAAVHYMRAWRKETLACQDAMEANLEKMEAVDLKGNPEEMESMEWLALSEVEENLLAPLA